MRLNGETFPEAEEEEAKESENFQPQELVVGYALTSKKKNSFLKPKLEVLARYLHNQFTRFVKFFFMLYSCLKFG